MRTIGLHQRTLFLLMGAAALFSACSTNPATGDRQFTALMPAGQEERIGASEHTNILKQFGGAFPDQALEAYLNRVGMHVAANTERPDVTYKFFILDTPTVNAFALPGGYVYVSRGLLALAGDEAELAGVLTHEIAHVTARHSAERYSQGVLAGLGMAVLSAAVNDPGISQVAGIGSDLALKSYSRSQEYQADELGIRYLSRAGYDPLAAARFLEKLDNWTGYESHLAGKSSTGGGYFATHPQTDDRVARARTLALTYPVSTVTNANEYTRRIEGLAYGESARTGFVRGQRFIHPDLGITFKFPAGFRINNKPDRVIGLSQTTGTGVVFDGATNRDGLDARAYLTVWAGSRTLRDIEDLQVNGARGATARLEGGLLNGKPATIRLVAIEWTGGRMYRFQMAMPHPSPALERDLITMVHSFRGLTSQDRDITQGLRLQIVRAGPEDTVQTLAHRMNKMALGPNEKADDRFRVLNGMGAQATVQPGGAYKVIR